MSGNAKLGWFFFFLQKKNLGAEALPLSFAKQNQVLLCKTFGGNRFKASL